MGAVVLIGKGAARGEADRSAHSERWYVVAAKPARETLAFQQLVNQDFVVFLPRRNKTIRHRRRLLTREVPLFPGYVFVRLNSTARRWRAINGTLGVKYLISQDEKPVPLPIGFIESLRAYSDANDRVAYTPDIKIGDKVEMLAGPFASQVGELVSLDDRGRVAVLMNLLSGSVPVKTAVENLLPV